MAKKNLLLFGHLIFWYLSQVTCESNTYRGAVVEYSPVLTKDEKSRVASNVENYKKFMKLAKAQGADIIVFPENGLLTASIQSPIPDPADKIAPCDSPNFVTTETVKDLSCASKINGIYSIVNLLEKRACNKDDKNCPPRGYYIHNTNVGFDRNGTVIARYSKFNLYDEPLVNKTENPEMVFFDTDFGVRFGTFTCFDIQFATPALKLVQQYNITDFVYTTYWFSELPFLTALQVQRGWAETNNVNLLASGVNFPLTATFGSGIYNGKFGDLVSVMPETSTSTILIADIPKIKGSTTGKTIRNQTKIISLPSAVSDTPLSSLPLLDLEITPFFQGGENTTEEGVELLRDHMELFQSEIIAAGKKFERNICSGNNFCCNFQVSMDSLSLNSSEYTPRAIVFDGTRKFGKSFKGGVQTCGVVLCRGPEIMNCTNRIKKIPGMFIFKEIQIKGNFQSKNSFQMPTTLTDGERLEPLTVNKYQFIKKKKDDSMEVSLELLWPVINLQSFGIWGRDFSRDPNSGASSVMYISALCIPLVLLVQVFGSLS